MKKFDEVILKIIRSIVAFLLFIMFLLIIKEVIFRYIFSAPAFWTEELARYTMFYMVLMGSSLAIRDNKHPALLFIIQNFPSFFQKIWKLFIDIIVLSLLVVIFVEGYLMSVDEMISKTPALRVSFFCVYIAFPLGALLMMLQIIMKYIFGSKKLNEEGS